ncbi:hypothetical protein [Lactobacillus sp. LL6]|uniref:hypothetical protein n=1 Tax=Lactobacillus sp. LL6 TaxID=2596827 RepID=UPI0011848A5F|nr:hypothetical protein [Lactobacillus sp. LL6]TSO25974.1 hypothetical protein FOD82_02585 [Lactobacillus sp. LL6]
MTLTNFLQLIKNLNPDYFIYLKIKENILPLGKIQITSNNCLLLAGNEALTIKQLIKIVKNLRKRGIPLLIKDSSLLSVYGIQISLKNSRIIIM